MYKTFNQRIKRAKANGTKDEELAAKEHLLCFLDAHVEMLQSKLEAVQEEERLESLARVQTLSLPSPKALDRILRYETAVERQLYRALDQLERVQRRRNGDHVPPPLKLNVENS